MRKNWYIGVQGLKGCGFQAAPSLPINDFTARLEAVPFQNSCPSKVFPHAVQAVPIPAAKLSMQVRCKQSQES